MWLIRISIHTCRFQSKPNIIKGNKIDMNLGAQTHLSMLLPSPIDFKAWLQENEDKLKPPVNNYCVYAGEDFIVMAVGGPNRRNDFHVNQTEVCIDPISSIFDFVGMVLPVQGRNVFEGS